MNLGERLADGPKSFAMQCNQSRGHRPPTTTFHRRLTFFTVYSISEFVDSAVTVMFKHLLYLVCLCATLLLVAFRESDPVGEKRRLTSETKPPIYTFFEWTPQQQLGFGSEEDELLPMWSQYWEQAGWEPRILTLEDAKAHPDYEKMRGVLDSIPSMRDESKFTFLRWLAVAHQGGGWFAEKDTFPLHRFADEGFELPQNGLLTIWERYTPSLVSGKKEEWERVVEALIQIVEENKDKGDWTDRTALEQRIKRSGGKLFSPRMSVLTGSDVTRDRPRHPDDCARLGSSRRAIHFSWKEVSRTGKKKKSSRVGTVRSFYDLWDYSCKPEHTA